MRNSLLVMLSSGVLAVSLSAQQSNSNSSLQPTTSAGPTAPASPSSGTTRREPLQSPNSQNFWDGDEPNAVNLISHPFARKSYVRRQIQPIRDRLNELDQLTASNAKMIRDVDAQAQNGIQLASSKANEADQHASLAGNAAQAAQLTATQTATHVSKAEQVVGTIDKYQDSSQTEIRFRSGQTALSKTAKTALDQLASTLKDQGGYVIEVRGFAPGHDRPALATSKIMADSVVRYLVLNDKIPVYRISAVGMGNAPATAETAAKGASGGRVQISLLRHLISATEQ